MKQKYLMVLFVVALMARSVCLLEEKTSSTEHKQCDADSKDCVAGDYIEGRAEKYSKEHQNKHEKSDEKKEEPKQDQAKPSKETNQTESPAKTNQSPKETKRSINKEKGPEIDLLQMASMFLKSQQQPNKNGAPQIDLGSILKLAQHFMGNNGNKKDDKGIDFSALLNIAQAYMGNGKTRKKGKEQENPLAGILEMAKLFMPKEKQQGIDDTKPNKNPLANILQLLNDGQNQNILTSLLGNEKLIQSLMQTMLNVPKDQDKANPQDMLIPLVQSLMASFTSGPPGFKQNDTAKRPKESAQAEFKSAKEEHTRKQPKSDFLANEFQANMLNTLMSSGVLDEWKNDLNKLLFDNDGGNEKKKDDSMTDVHDDTRLNAKNSMNDLLSKLGIDSDATRMALDVAANYIYADKTLSKYASIISEKLPLLWNVIRVSFRALQESPEVVLPRMLLNARMYNEIITEMIADKKIKSTNGDKYLVTLFGLLRDDSKRSTEDCLEEFQQILDIVKYLQTNGVWDGVVNVISMTDVKTLRKGLSVAQKTYNSLKSQIRLPNSARIMKAFNVQKLMTLLPPILSVVKDPTKEHIKRTVTVLLEWVNTIDITQLTEELPPYIEQHITVIVDNLKSVIVEAEWDEIADFFSEPSNVKNFYVIISQHFVVPTVELWYALDASPKTVTCFQYNVCKFAVKKIKGKGKKMENTIRHWAGTVATVASTVRVARLPDDFVSVYKALLEGEKGVKCSKKYKC